LNKYSQDLPLWLQKLKVAAEIVGLILIPLLILHFDKEYKERDRADRQAAIDKEIGVRYVEISVAILRENPSIQTKELREWAIDTFKKYSPIPLTPKFIEELK
jgi:hypothetical protein